MDLKDEYVQLAEKMFGIIGVGAINCNDDEELCEEYSVYSTPTIKIFTENDSDQGTVYTGKKTWKAISARAANLMMNFVRIVGPSNYESFVSDSASKNKILLFTDKKSTSPLFKSLSKTFKDQLAFGEVRKAQDESEAESLFKKFNI